jgi:hypothetical protein
MILARVDQFLLVAETPSSFSMKLVTDGMRSRLLTINRLPGTKKGVVSELPCRKVAIRKDGGLKLSHSLRRLL